MGTRDTSPIPQWAVQCWATETDIFVALPMTQGGIPYIAKFPKSEGGLAQALAVLCARRPEVPKPSASAPANYTHPPRQPQVRRSKAEEKLRAETTEAQRETARKLIAKMGLK